MYILYDHVVYFGGLEAPILYMTLMYYDVTFWLLMKTKIMMIDFILFTCV